MRVVVAIHDVTPAFAGQVETLWDVCVSRGILPALFVVPSWHGAWRLEDDLRFTGWLRRCARQGAEVFLHGERHDEDGSERGLLHHARALGRTEGEGEFLTLTRAVARNRIARGLRRLRALGLEPTGFVAPAWLSSRDTWQAVRDSGLRFSEDDASIHIVGNGTRVRAPVIRWSARSVARAHVSVAVAAAARFVWRGPLVRIALHPRDITSAPVRRSVLETFSVYAGRMARPTQYCAL
jgi:predicted deacetylase